MSMLRWADLTREELGRSAPGAVCVLPVAATEQHGPHLPTAVDSILVTTIAERACERVPAPTTTLLTPTQCFGASDHHLAFGGTLSLRTTTLHLVLLDLVRSIRAAGCPRILILNGHGGNRSTCATVAAEAASARIATVAFASYWELVSPPDPLVGRFPGHAGAIETALMLAVAPALVRLDDARPPPETPRAAPLGLGVAEPDAWQRIDGFSDDPRQATAQLGVDMLESCIDAVAAAVVHLSERGA